MDDLDGELLHITYGVLHMEDVRAYIHFKLEEFNHTKLSDVWYTNLIGDDFKLKK